MENFMFQHAVDFLAAHHQMIVGMTIGAVISHPGTLAVLLFNGFIRIPGVGSWIAHNPEAAKSWADQFDKAIESCVDKYVKDNAEPVVVVAPPPAATPEVKP